MKNLTWQNPEQLFVAQELINKVKSKCCGIKVDLDEHGNYYLNDQLSGLDAIESELNSAGKELMVQERLIQHPVLNSLYPHSLNTLRVASAIQGDEVTILYAVQRLGVGCNVVDNASQGGLLIGVNDDGSLKKYGYYLPKFGTKTAVHPDTHIQFNSIKIPFYNEVKELVVKAHKAFSHTVTIGWDIAILVDGPILIEGNSCPSEIIQMCCGGIRNRIDKYFA